MGYLNQMSGYKNRGRVKTFSEKHTIVERALADLASHLIFVEHSGFSPSCSPE